MSPTRSEPSSSTRDCGNARESEHPPLYAPRTKEGRRPSPSHLELLEQLRVDERDRLDVREDAHHLLHRQDRPGVRELRVAQRVVVLVEQRRHALDVVLLGRDDLLEHLRLLQPLLLRVGAPRRAVRRRGDRGDRQQLALGRVARELEHGAHLLLAPLLELLGELGGAENDRVALPVPRVALGEVLVVGHDRGSRQNPALEPTHLATPNCSRNYRASRHIENLDLAREVIRAPMRGPLRGA